ncbi:toll/interleukin-1 receptor domain-containing protein [Acidimicrobiaceae bacterium]|nr:toll/interleukin-1 receptor domain-containing protein [Acidimicrobiaceae bacterium]
MSIFVSYAADDISHVNSFSKQNSELPISKRNNLWISYEKNKNEKNIEPGSDFRNEIIKAIKKSKGAVLFISNDFLKSPFVINYELPEIFKKKKENASYKIIPVFVDRIENFSLYPELENLHYSNTPNTSLSNLRGAQYRLTISEILNDCNSVVKSKTRLLLSSLVLLATIPVFLTVDNLDNNSDQIESSNILPTTQNEISTTSSTLPVTTTQKLTEEAKEEIEYCLVTQTYLNYYVEERINFILERRMPFDKDMNVMGLSKSLNNLNWEDQEEIEFYTFQYFAHHMINKSLTDSNNEFYSEEIQYFMEEEIYNNKSDLFAIRNDLNLLDQESEFYQQTSELLEVLDQFDYSLGRLAMYWKSAEDTDRQTDEYNNNYFDEAKQYFQNAMNLYASYKIKYYPETFKFDLNKLSDCGNIEEIDQSYVEGVVDSVNVFYTRKDLFDLEMGDCFNMPSDFGFKDFQTLRPESSFQGYVHLVPVGWYKDMFPSYLTVSKVDCKKPHQVEIFYKDTFSDNQYGFNWVAGIPVEMENKQQLGISSLVSCRLNSTNYLTFPTDYTGFFIGSFYNAKRGRYDEREHLCFYYQYEIDEFGKQIGHKKNTGSTRLIDKRSPKVFSFDYIAPLNSLEKGMCWIDPETDSFDRQLIHESRLDKYEYFTYIGYSEMEVRVINCEKSHQNEIIFNSFIDTGSYESDTELKDDVINICEEELSYLIPFTEDNAFLDEKEIIGRDNFGLDIFINSDEITNEKISLICSIYSVTPYSDIFYPAGYGEWFIEERMGSIFDS